MINSPTLECHRKAAHCNLQIMSFSGENISGTSHVDFLMKMADELYREVTPTTIPVRDKQLSFMKQRWGSFRTFTDKKGFYRGLAISGRINAPKHFRLYDRRLRVRYLPSISAARRRDLILISVDVYWPTAGITLLFQAVNDKRHIMAWGYLIGCGGVVLVGEHLVPKDAKIVSSGARVSRCFCISGDGKLLINVVHHDGGAVLLCKEGVAVKGNAYEAISLATGVVFMEQRENELNIYGLSDDGLGPVSHEVIRGKLKSVSATSEMVCCTVRMGAEDIVFILRGINLIQEQIIRQFGEVNISRAVALGDHILTFGTFFQRRCIGQLKLQRAGYEWQEIRRYPWDESVSCTDIDFHACRLEVRCESFVDSPEPALVDCASEMIYFEQCDSEKHRRIVVEDTVLADDGEKLPVTLFGNSEDMLAPKALMLTVYGAYGVTIVSSYASHRQSLIRRGVVYAIARVRGGGDRGSSWHAAGSGKNKIRGVLDLIQIVDRLRQKYKNCRPMLAVEAGSAGGLLVAAAINIRTDLFDSVILTAPYVCPLRTVRNESDAYVEFERAELGISSDLQGCETIEAYDPLLNVRNNCSYPPILVVAGKSDTKVRLNDVLEWCRNIDSSSSGSCKYVARIIVLYDGGHEGPSSRTCHYMTWAIQKAFICKTLNIEV